MEFGPRALGNRSIIADPRDGDMQRKLNLQVKFREGFRPFAPAVLEDSAREYFDLTQPSPYMSFVADVARCHQRPLPDDYASLPLFERLYWQRSDIPAVTHVDYSARVQTVSRDTNPRFWDLLDAFRRLTGCAVLVNTSFNVRGEPIVCTPAEAYRCFMRTDLEFLVMGDYLLDKRDQPAANRERWKATFAPD
jgi:carbamoyltransferase